MCKKIVLFFFITFQFGYSQKLNEEEFDKYQKKVKFFIYSDLDSTSYYIQKIKTSANYSHLVFANSIEGYLYQLKNGDTIKSNKSFEISLNYLNKIDSELEKNKTAIGFLNLQGLTYWKRGLLSKAIEKYTAAKTIAVAINDNSQLAKIVNNISLVYGQIKNFKLAIAYAKELEENYDKRELSYSRDEINANKANTYFNLGSFYENYFYENLDRKELSDSAEFYYKKAVVFSKDFLSIKLNSQINLGNLYKKNEEYEKAEKEYLSTLIVAEKNNLMSSYININYNLGDLYLNRGKYDKSLVYFMKVDSLCENLNTNTNKLEQISAKYSLAKIFYFYNDIDKAEKYITSYKDEFKRNESIFVNEEAKINSKIAIKDIEFKLQELQNDIFYKKIKNNFFIATLSLVLVFLGFYLYKNSIEKKRANEKVKQLILEFKSMQVSKVDVVEDTLVSAGNSINIDEEKENEIVKKLNILEKEEYFLKTDFNLQTVAKKIKTNTTYLSFVVNKRFGKSFSEYSNELKINYVIKELINNLTYRKYTTQAIAESVGFKNAVSFSKSFNKRTGVTPAQFIKKLDESSNQIKE